MVDLLNREINEILADPAERKALEDQGMVAAGGSPADFQATIAADYDLRGKIIKGLSFESQ